MSIMLCLNKEDVESELKKCKRGFVTEDHRIYDKIEVADDATYYELDIETVEALYNLQTDIEQAMNGQTEMGFGNVVEEAKRLQNSFKAAIKQIKFKPLIRYK